MESFLLSRTREVPDMDVLLTQYLNPLLRMCFLYLKDKHLAEDAVQDTFLRVYEKYPQFRGEAEEQTWIMRIAINVCKGYLRSAWHKKVDDLAALETIPTHYHEDTLRDDTLVLEVMKLPPKYKEVVMLFYYQDMSIKEIAKVLRCPSGTVSVRLKRAREQLEKKLKGWYYDE